jgi:hypothetical protein
MPREVWLSALKLSTMWNFCAIRTLAIKQLDGVDMDAVDKILLAREHHLPAWLSSGYNSLANRKENISLAEVERLGLDTAVRMFHVREERLVRGLDDGSVLLTIHREFARELKEEEEANAAYSATPVTVSYRDLPAQPALASKSMRRHLRLQDMIQV